MILQTKIHHIYEDSAFFPLLYKETLKEIKDAEFQSVSYHQIHDNMAYGTK
jgi:hypothetical protein